MIAIPLHSRKYPDLVTVVSDEDADLAALARWFPAHVRTNVYARTRLHGKQISMHRLILARMLGRSLEEWEDTDHEDRDSLNNQRENLRTATPGQNQANRPALCTNTSGFKGVRRMRRRWRAEIMLDGKTIHIGVTDTPEEAARLYDDAAREFFGDFAFVNFPERIAAESRP